MSNPIPRLVLLMALLALSACGAATTTGAVPMTEEAESPEAVLRRYEAALNHFDADAIVDLYSPDAVFMAQHREPSIGAEAIATAYREIFSMIRLDITFDVDEVVQLSPTVAYARTRSAGTTTVLATETQTPESNQELFILTREPTSPEWRISRYIFSTTRPLAGH